MYLLALNAFSTVQREIVPQASHREATEDARRNTRQPVTSGRQPAGYLGHVTEKGNIDWLMDILFILCSILFFGQDSRSRAWGFVLAWSLSLRVLTTARENPIQLATGKE